jgi:hypothetical protein
VKGKGWRVGRREKEDGENDKLGTMRGWAAIAAMLVLFTRLLAAQGAAVPADFPAQMDQSRARLCALYGVTAQACAAPISVQIAATPGEAASQWPNLPPYAAGAAEPRAQRLVVVLSRCGPYPFGDPGQTLKHELSHILLPRALGFAPPRWFDEGLAMRVSAEWGLRDEWFAALALPAVAHGSWRLERVESDFAGGESEVRRSYALAKGFVRDLFRDDADISAFLSEARRDGSVDTAFRLRFGTSPDGAFRNWAKHLPWWGAWVVALSSPEVLWLGVIALFLLAVAAAWRRRRKKYQELED